jgi:hypothetical protein
MGWWDIDQQQLVAWSSVIEMQSVSSSEEELVEAVLKLVKARGDAQKRVKRRNFIATLSEEGAESSGYSF